ASARSGWRSRGYGGDFSPPGCAPGNRPGRGCSWPCRGSTTWPRRTTRCRRPGSGPGRCPPARSAPRTASAAPPPRRRPPPCGAGRRGPGTTATPSRPAGCPASAPGSASSGRSCFVPLSGPVDRQRGPVLVEPPALADVLLGQAEQLAGGGRVALGQHGVARLVVDVLLQRQARGPRVELEWVLPLLFQLGVVADQRPVAR